MKIDATKISVIYNKDRDIFTMSLYPISKDNTHPKKIRFELTSYMWEIVQRKMKESRKKEISFMKNRRIINEKD